MLLNHTGDIDSMSNQCPQTTTNQFRADLLPLFSSVRPMGSKRNELHVSFALFHEDHLPDVRANKVFATIEETIDL